MNDQELSEVIAGIAKALPPSAIDLDVLRRRVAAEDRSRQRGRRNVAAAIAAAAAVAAVIAGVLVAGYDDSSVRIEEPAVRPTSPTSVPTVPSTATAPSPASVTTVVGVADGAAVLVERLDRAAGTVVVELADRVTGAVIRTVEERPAVAGSQSPFLDMDLAPDGTVYLAVLGDNPEWVGQLMIVAPDGTERTSLPFVRSVRLSPDGRSLAVVVVSPDGDGDGLGLQAVRVLDIDSERITTVFSTPLDIGPDGTADGGTAWYRIESWSPDGQAVIVTEECCDFSNLFVVRTDGSSAGALPRVDGDAAALLGFDPAGRYIVERRPFNDAGGADLVVVTLDPESGKVSSPILELPDLPDVTAYELVGDQVPGVPTGRGEDALIDRAPFRSEGMDILSVHT